MLAGLQTAQARHVHVEQHQVRHLGGDPVQRVLAVTGLHDFILVSDQRSPHHPANLRVVIHHQYLSSTHETISPRYTGSEKLNTEPWPGSLVTQILPPCASTMPLAMARPIPVPGTRKRCSRARKNLSKMRACSCSSMPLPRSATLITMRPSPARAAIVTGDPGGEYFSALSSSCFRTCCTKSKSTSASGRSLCSLISTLRS